MSESHVLTYQSVSEPKGPIRNSACSYFGYPLWPNCLANPKAGYHYLDQASQAQFNQTSSHPSNF